MRQASSRPFASAREASRRTASSTTSRNANGTSSSVSCRASTFEKSRMSLTRPRRASLDSLTVSQIVALFFCEGGAERQVGHADDRVHRRPDLMAHVGEKLALGDRGLLRPPSCALELTLRPPRVRDIPRHRMNQAEIPVGDGAPLEPPVASVGTPIAIVERRQLHVVDDRGPCANRCLAVVGVDELQPRLGQQFLSRYPQRALPCWIQPDEIPGKVGDAEQVPRQCEEPVELLLGPFPLDEQANLAADRREHSQQVGVGLADLATEELHDPQDLGAPHHGEAERGVQARPLGLRRAREVGIVDDVRNPGGLVGSTTLVPAGRRLPQRRSRG